MKSRESLLEDGQSSLSRSRQLTILIALVWSVAVAASLSWNIFHSWSVLLERVQAEAKVAFEKDVVYRRWNARVGPIYMQLSPRTPANPHLKDWPERDITTETGKRLTMVNPAYMTRLVHELGALESGVLGRITSLRPMREDNIPDPWERKALMAFDEGKTEYSEVRPLTPRGEDYLRFMRPLYVEKGCLKCHAAQGYEIGDVRGGISVSVPMADSYRAFDNQLLALSLAHFVLWAVAMLAAYWGHRRIQAHMQHRLDLELELFDEEAKQKNLLQQLKQAQSQLVHSEKMASLGLLSAGLAHELNNPLSYVNSNLDTLKDNVQDLMKVIAAGEKAGLSLPVGHSARQELERVSEELDLNYLRDDMLDLIQESREGGVRAQTIIRNLKDFARNDQGVWEEASFEKGFESSQTIAHNITKHKADIVREYGDSGLVYCSPDQIHQVMLNLIINAAQAMEVHGRITLRTGGNDQEAWFEVEDNGAGMSENTQEQLFEPFFTTKAPGQGTGLGMSISYGIVQGHEGRFEVDSDLGRGSRIRVTLPRIHIHRDQ